MTGVVTIFCVALGLALAAALGIQIYRDRPINRAHLVTAAILEVAIVVYVMLRVLDLIGGHRVPRPAVLGIYLVALVLILPVAAALSWVEVTRWGSVILAAGALVTCVQFARINQLWLPHG
ncbi:MAG: hypothetical protein DLM58_06755 [Pseudonocardiales bacterium]|nr:MAG: hypothetical protein DLM58_06755 [Pseudonocardiales bacterium]